MRRISVLFVLGIVLCIGNSFGQTIKSAFNEALNKNDLKGAEKILKDWDKIDINDPELFVAYFNYYTKKSLIENKGLFNNDNTQTALSHISDGIRSYPTRFDMRVAKMYLAINIKDYSAAKSDVLDMIKQSKEINNQWKGQDFHLLEKPDEMFYGAVQDYMEEMLDKKKEESHNDILEVLDAMVANYPDYEQNYLNISTIRLFQKQYDLSIEALNKAIKLKPGNAVVYYNLAYAYESKGDLPNTKKNLQLAIDYSKDTESKLRDEAQKKLNNLNGNK